MTASATATKSAALKPVSQITDRAKRYRANVEGVRPQENPSNMWKRLKRMMGVGKSPWIAYETTDSEAKAQSTAGVLEARGINHVRVQKVGGGMLSKEKPKYEVQVLREGLRKLARTEFGGSSARLGGKSKTQTYKGYRISGNDVTGYKIPAIDKDSTFDTMGDAKEFVMAQAAKRNPSGMHQCIIGTRKTEHNTFLEAHRHGLKEQGAGVHSGFKVKGPDGEVKEYGRDGKRRNPERIRNPADSAASMYESFHGKPSRSTTTVTEEMHVHEHLAEIGELILLKVKTLLGDNVEIIFSKEENPKKSIAAKTKAWIGRRYAAIGKAAKAWINPRKINPNGPVLLCSNEDGTQLFILGGDQKLDLGALGMGDFANKESVIVGEIKVIDYFTTKIWEKGAEPEIAVYTHKFNEDTGGPRPMLRYDTVNKRCFIDGGLYRIEKPLMGTSPGIEN